MDLHEGVRRFRTEIHPRSDQLFAELADGQQPSVLFITCADSRIDPALITQTDPGSLFVCRNAGNIVPVWDARPDGMMASVEFAVAALGVSHAIVCGHSNCGAMAALLDPPAPSTLPAVSRWLPEAALTPRDDETIGDLIARNARTQLEHLRTHPSVDAAVQAGSLHLRAWVYDIGSGEIHDVTDPEDVTLVGQ